ncbi:hypothetical protein QTP88_007538 [Uroleucon formosanum]
MSFPYITFVLSAGIGGSGMDINRLSSSAQLQRRAYTSSCRRVINQPRRVLQHRWEWPTLCKYRVPLHLFIMQRIGFKNFDRKTIRAHTSGRKRFCGEEQTTKDKN